MLLELIPMAIGTMTAVYGVWKWRCANQFDIKVTDAQGRTVYMRSSGLDDEQRVIDGGELGRPPTGGSGAMKSISNKNPVDDLVETTIHFVCAHVTDFKYRADPSFNSRGSKPYTADYVFWEGLDSKHMRIVKDKHGLRDGGKKAFIDDLEIPLEGYDKIIKAYNAAQAVEMNNKIRHETAARIDKMKKAIEKKPKAEQGFENLKKAMELRQPKEASTKSDIVDPFRPNLERSHNHNWFGDRYYGKHISKVERFYEAYGDTYFYKISFQDGSAANVPQEVFELQLGNSAAW